MNEMKNLLWQLYNFKFWLGKQFRTTVYIHGKTRIASRPFPFKLDISSVTDLQTRINKLGPSGGVINLESAIYMIDETVELKDHVILQGNRGESK
jgi:hypothetical protein